MIEYKFMMKIMMMMIMLNLNILFINIKMLMYIMSLEIMVISMFFMFSMNYSNNWMLIYSWMGIDSISFILTLLTMWIISLMFLISFKMMNKKIYSMVLLILLISLILSFMTLNYFMFYLFFEISLLPTMLLIMGWGYQPERINASMYMLMYTMFASLPMLIIMFYLFNMNKSMNYLIILNKYIKFEFLSNLMYLYMILAFLVKLPMFMLHMWLPKAHVEAPITGSMILAGIMLKLGGYGIARSMMMMMNYSKMFNYFFMMISLIGMVIMSLVCLRQFDMKLIVAYSSVVHMGMMLFGIMSMMYYGFMGGVIMMIAHGLCSSAMFILVNLLYERSKSRNMYMNKGMIIIMPVLSMWWFMFCACNMSSPISLNLLSELMIIIISLNWSINIIMVLCMGMYISAMYSLYLFSYSQHGKLNNLVMKFNNNNLNDYMILILHWIPLNLLILKLDLFM
ncbi:NADH dehydrogenase subunit 4 (mitochondrion) [Muscidifurax raptorellus]|uniref:NADH dehydrogenase subunit 4 n=1 Tax=Muscidifurax raptorellus TaxID=51938 RepID=UPI001E7EC4C6|nr:NADH dehydrogenase subunit 4 [Muscidifurax raptorellus]UAT98634.1 NADH dehydrogenase subunit 4 [Muscidifurax raptorellus]